VGPNVAPRHDSLLTIMSLHTISVFIDLGCESDRDDRERRTLSTEKKKMRFLRQGDEVGAKDLIEAGYEFRGISKKGSQIFILRNPSSIEADAVDAIQTTFGLERDLQEALRSHIEQLEPGMKITDGGKEHILEVGRIDITAQDIQGRTVIIELKAGTADREVVGQILSYMGGVNSKNPVRGILIAADFPKRAIAAARAVPNLQLKKYGFTFTFEEVRKDST